jgi:hypothetical protein
MKLIKLMLLLVFTVSVLTLVDAYIYDYDSISSSIGVFTALFYALVIKFWVDR